MYSNSTLPGKPVSATALPISAVTRPQLRYQLIRKNIKIIFVVIFLAVLLFASKSASAQLDLNFGTNFTQKVESTPVLHAKYLYTTVVAGYDCIVTITDIQGGASIYQFDDNSLANAGAITRFQPIITVPNIANNTSYVRFKFQLIMSGSYNNSTNTGTNAIATQPIWFRSYDVDGNGATGGVSEFVELNNSFTGSWVDNPTNLIARTPITPGGTAYIVNSPTINGAAISDEGVFAFNGFIYADTESSWEIIGGSTTGAAPPNPGGGFNDADRLGSWSFKHEEAIPGIDFGDAPITYSGAMPITPAYHLVPSVAGNVKLYLGNNKPDADYDPSGNIAANTDDNNNEVNDEDGLPYIYFPKYSGSGAYTTSVTAVNISGADAYIYSYIDFNGDGDFTDVNEKSAPITVPSTATTILQTFTATFASGFSYNAASTTRYARFRIASVSAEAGNANGAAANGEVEDFRFNTSIDISGMVWKDINGNAIREFATEGLYIAGGLKVVLTDANDKVIQVVDVSNTGSYTITDLPYNVSSYKVILSTATGAAISAGNSLAAVSVPDNYVLTGENKDGTPETAGDGKIILPSTTTSLLNYNFGIEQLPETINKTKTFPYVMPGYGNPLTSVPLQGSDPDDSQMPASAGGKFIITQLPPASQAILTYNDMDITTAGFIITNYNPAQLGIRHTTLAMSTFFKYATIDAAGKQDPTPATYTINLASLLPLNGLNLSANQQGNTIKLNWNVTGERNVIRYELEYSINNTNFTSLTSVYYRASANSANAYTYTHLPSLSNGILYYRVIQYRADGSTSISNQVSVRLNDKNTPSITAMPTLISDLANLRIRTVTPGKTFISVVDNNGKLVMNKEISLTAGTTTFTIDGWAPLANGTYYIQVSNTDLKTTIKVMVQH